MNNINYLNNLYTQKLQNTTASPYVNGTNAASKAAAVQQEEKAAASVKENTSKAETDRAEFSKDTQVNKKMSDAERADLVASLKADLDNQMTRFTNMMTQMFQKQGITGITAQSDDFWRTIASGNFVVDAQTKAEAQEAISEDGYWGVKQTSQRIFDFAQALAGDDPEKMKKMQDAVEKGFGEAAKSWGGKMPSITDETHTAVTDLFNGYYESKNKPEK